jgi:hypothetical protein
MADSICEGVFCRNEISYGEHFCETCLAEQDFDPWEFVESWCESYCWEDELASGQCTVADLMASLRDLEKMEPSTRYVVDWEAVEALLERHYQPPTTQEEEEES